jgi:copper(I)-binding protein
MTGRRPARLARSVPAALLLLGTAALVAACTYFPSVLDVGGVRLQPERGRLVLQGGSAVLLVKVESTGKYGDTLTGADSALARHAELIGEAGTRVTQIEIPGATTFRMKENGPVVVLSDFTRPLSPGEVVIVTLRFVKSGAIGIVTVVE